MNHIIKLLLITLCTPCVITASLGQNEGEIRKFENDQMALNAAIDSGKVRESLPKCRQQQATAKRLFGRASHNYTVVTTTLGNCFQQLEMLDSAEKYYNESLSACIDWKGADDESTLIPRSLLAMIRLRKKDLHGAYENILIMHKRRAEYPDALREMAPVMVAAEGAGLGAEGSLDSARAMLRLLSEYDSLAVDARRDRCTIYYFLSHDAVVRQSYSEALALVDSAVTESRILGDTAKADLAVFLGKKAEILGAQSKWTEALAVSEESLPLSISATGPTSQRTMEQHYQLGYINARLTKYPEAIAHYKSAIGILERRGKNLDTANLLNYVGHYATSLQLMGQLDSVVALRSTYLGYARAGYGANSLDYADYVYDLGLGQADQKDMVNAEKNVKSALLIYEKRLDSTDYRIGYAVASLYSILLDQGKTAEAAVYKERAEAVKRDQE